MISVDAGLHLKRKAICFVNQKCKSSRDKDSLKFCSTELESNEKPLRHGENGLYEARIIHNKRWKRIEDITLSELVSMYGPNWEVIKEYFPGRSELEIKVRYLNKFDPKLTTAKFTPEEDEMIIGLHHKHGNRWNLIAKSFPQRNAYMIKNRYYSKLKSSSHCKQSHHPFCDASSCAKRKIEAEGKKEEVDIDVSYNIHTNMNNREEMIYSNHEKDIVLRKLFTSNVSNSNSFMECCDGNYMEDNNTLEQLRIKEREEEEALYRMISNLKTNQSEMKPGNELSLYNISTEENHPLVEKMNRLLSLITTIKKIITNLST